jgi:hypothetical protein
MLSPEFLRFQAAVCLRSARGSDDSAAIAELDAMAAVDNAEREQLVERLRGLPRRGRLSSARTAASRYSCAIPIVT